MSIFALPASAWSTTTQMWKWTDLAPLLDHGLPGMRIKDQCTTGKERRITRWEHEDILEAVQRRLDEHPEKMRQRRETVEHPFGTIKSWMGSTTSR